MSKRLVDGAINLFYFSGHGAEYDGVHYLLPLEMMDIEPASFADEAVSLNRVMASFNKGARDTINIMLLDCCRENKDDETFKGLPKGATWSGTGKGRMSKTFETPQDSQFFIGLACDPGSAA